MAGAYQSQAGVRVIATGALAFVLAYAPVAYAQIRPVPPIGPPGVTPPIVAPPITPPVEPPIIRPPVPPPVNPPSATPDVRIVTDAGFVVGTVGRASVELPAASSTAAATSGGTTRTSTATGPVYRWTITNGKLLSDPADPVVEFTAGTTGSITLGVSVVADGVSYSASSRVGVLPPTAAGAMTVAATVPASPTDQVTASVPRALNNDRTFRWSVSGDARIVRGQGSAEIAFTPGTAGIKEITCVVTLRNLGTVRLRSYLTVTGTGSPVPITINQGDGTGMVPAGSRVTIMANPPATGMLFDRWTGDVAVLGDDPLAVVVPQATITVPAEPVTLTATYKPVPAWTPVRMSDAVAVATARATTAGSALYYVPPDARGIVILLHDAGGTSADWFARPDHLLLARNLVDAGFGVAALTSSSRNWAAQTTFATNADAQAAASVAETLVRDGHLPPSSPWFVLGLGAGAQAAPRLADLLQDPAGSRPIAGTILLCGAGTEELAALSSVPAMFSLAGGDTSPGYAGTAAARANASLLAGRGVATSIIETGITPLPARRLLKLAAVDPDFTAEAAETIWSALRTAEILDANGYVKQTLSPDAVQAVLPLSLQRHGVDVSAQLQIAAAGRGVYSESAARIVDFMNQRAAAMPGTEPARITNVSTRSRIAFVSDTFGVTYTLAGNGPATILIRAVGPGLSRFGVANRCLATRVEVYHGSTLVASNEGWDSVSGEGTPVAAATAAVGAFPLAAGSPDAAVLLTLQPGAYQVLVKGVNGTTGEVLAEAYDVSRTATRFARFASLGRVDDAATENVVSGFVIQGAAPRSLLCRGIGPGLVQLGRPADAVMPDPALNVMAAGRRIGASDNWGDANPEVIRSIANRAGLPALTAASRDAALVTAFQPGAYLLEASAAGAAPGEVMIEVTAVP